MAIKFSEDLVPLTDLKVYRSEGEPASSLGFGGLLMIEWE